MQTSLRAMMGLAEINPQARAGGWLHTYKILEASESKPLEIKILEPNASTKGTVTLNHLPWEDEAANMVWVMERPLSEDLKDIHPPASIGILTAGSYQDLRVFLW